MLSEFEVKSCTRTCTASGREIKPGEVFYSVLEHDGAEMIRRDYAAENWPGLQETEPEQVPDAPISASSSWWRSKLPAGDERPRLAPNEVLLNLFAELAGNAEQATFRYVLGLLLIRRKLLRLEETLSETAGEEILLLSCASRGEEFRLPVVAPSLTEAEQLEARINDLLYTGT